MLRSTISFLVPRPQHPGLIWPTSYMQCCNDVGSILPCENYHGTNAFLTMIFINLCRSISRLGRWCEALPYWLFGCNGIIASFMITHGPRHCLNKTYRMHYWIWVAKPGPKCVEASNTNPQALIVHDASSRIIGTIGPVLLVADGGFLVELSATCYE